jgi:3-methylcrotonyl-CoA carboxylase alpha subunit
VFHKILIANRGEIACRVIKTARKMGVLTVAVYSDADRDSLHVSMADEAVHIGASPSRESYLLSQRIIDAAKQTGAQAIHPGYGFLSENAAFAQDCQQNNITFIGPPIDAINAMGSKSAAKSIMELAGVPLVPGYHDEDQEPARLKDASNAMGYPVLLKASAGGGGKGMRQVWYEEDFDEALTAAKRESLNSFNDDKMLVEKYIMEPRHVEIQVFFDQHGNGVYLAERDCSIQRRHQKVIEEAPAPGMSNSLRQQMGEAAINAAKAINYQGAGTVEFLLDKDGAFYFMEMNTRLQVEHPVTEMITGQDLVEWQLRVAAGEQLPLQQADITIQGHSFEARIYAEDPDNEFLPVTGKLSYLSTPEENEYIRIDTGIRQGDEVSVYYDPMIAKLVVWDEDRDKALRRLSTALSEYRISGLKTNIDFLYNISNSKPFAAADLDTSFIEKHHSDIFHDSQQDINSDIPIAALYLLLQQQQSALSDSRHSRDPYSPWNQTNTWRMNEAHTQHLKLLCHQQEVDVQVEQVDRLDSSRYRIMFNGIAVDARGSLSGNLIDGHRLKIDINGYQTQAVISQHDDIYSLYRQQCVFHFSLLKPHLGDQDLATDSNALRAPMNGTIIELLIPVGGTVKKGQALIVMEAMKMEHTIRAPADGVVQELYYESGDMVEGGAELLKLEETQT